MKPLLKSLAFILGHPLSGRHKLRALKRWMSWQIGSRLLPGNVAVPFAGRALLLASPGMTGATGNIYCGLHEFYSMAFAMHLLRPGELFVDVGSNVGSYAVLAGSIGARCVAFEPVPSSFRRLLDNIALNRYEDRVTALNLAVGDTRSSALMTSDEDTTNRIVTASDLRRNAVVEVQMVRLDDVVDGDPVLIKIDVEGSEPEVLRGAYSLLRRKSLLGVIIEVNRNHAVLHAQMRQAGFLPYDYFPFERKIWPASAMKAGRRMKTSDNVLFVRNEAVVARRLASAPATSILDVAV